MNFFIFKVKKKQEIKDKNIRNEKTITPIRSWSTDCQNKSYHFLKTPLSVSLGF